MIAFVLAVTVAASPAVGQGPPTIDSGMTRAQVVAKLGEPMSTRTYDGHTYLLYKNGCERTCGMSDLVVLDSDKVVDAVFRSNARHYSGTSSSPRMITAADLHQAPDKAISVVTAEKPEKAEKHAKVAKVAKVKVEAVKAEPVKVEKVENGEAAPKPAAAPPAAAPKLPEVFRPAPTPKKDTAKKSDAANKPQTIKKPTS